MHSCVCWNKHLHRGLLHKTLFLCFFYLTKVDFLDADTKNFLEALVILDLHTRDVMLGQV